jgi:ubiquinone/menaquinone biosynthesis C-methylase UbiE
MSKLAEQSYFHKIGELGRLHSLTKPFSDPLVGKYLLAVGVIFNLLPRPPARLLDLGCGTGWTSLFFARAGYTVIGQDISGDMIQAAEMLRDAEHLGNLNFVRGDYETLSFDQEFDCAVFFDSLHHCTDEAAALAGVFRALKPGGILITHEPGAGHSTQPESVSARERFGVNERDMPPSLIIASAFKAGFTEYEHYPIPSSVLRQMYVRKRRLNGGFWSRAKSVLHTLVMVLRWQFERESRSGLLVLRKPLT